MNPDDLERLVRTRRTSMLVTDGAVPHELVEQLCELAQWAPNHKRTWPWRFALCDGDGRAALGNTIADAMAAYGDPPEKVAKTRGKYLRTPATLVVGSAPGDTAERTAENRESAPTSSRARNRRPSSSVTAIPSSPPSASWVIALSARPSISSTPAGVCIQLLATMIQNADSAEPAATSTAASARTPDRTRRRPNSSTPRNADSRKKAKMPSAARAEPKTSPTKRE